MLTRTTMQPRRRPTTTFGIWIVVVAMATLLLSATAFVSSPATPTAVASRRTVAFKAPQQQQRQPTHKSSPRTSSSSSSGRSTTELYSFMGSDGGILGIGTPELVSCLFRRTTVIKGHGNHNTSISRFQSFHCCTNG